MEKVSEAIVVNVGQLLREEYQQLSCVRNQATELRNDLGTMNALFRMQSEADEGASDHFDREWMKQVRELGYDAEDCVDLYSLRVRSRLNGGMCSRWTHLLTTLLERRRLAGEILALRARATTISERYTRYGVNREAMRRSPSLLGPAPQVQAASAPAHALLRARDDSDPRHWLVGMAAQANTLANLLKQEKDDDQGHGPKVFSVVGFGGVGKTTMAMEVCRQLETEFPFQAMVSVSQAFEPIRDRKALLKRVLQQVLKPMSEGVKEEATLKDINTLDESGLSHKLETTLKGKRYLIVIDDVWTIRAWEAILSVLPENKTSRVIVTTRLETVAKACSPASVSGHYIHKMRPLVLEDSRKLFISRVFCSKGDCPGEFEEEMNKILKKCGGLPLAIVSMASVLADWTSPGSIDKWETIRSSIGSQMESNPTLEGMKHIVTLSYNHLPHELKSCMMYLSIFPEDYEINKERLLHRWIAEGLVLEKRGLTQMEVAESYFDELWSRNMVQPATFLSDGRVESCRVHDMLLEVMVSKSLESNFVSLIGAQYAGMSYDRVRRLSMHGAVGSSRGMGLDGMADVRHVRSLSMFQLQDHKLLDHLDKLTLLRVLDLEDCKTLTNRHVKYICSLYLLKFLSLKDTDISKVPREIRNLEHLQVLNVQGTKLGAFPEGKPRNRGLSTKVTNLEKLEHLLFSNIKDYSYLKWILPTGIGKMKALRTLGIVILGNDVQIAQELGELELLEDFAITIEQGELGDNEEVIMTEFTKSLEKMHSLRRLSVEHCFSDILSYLHKLEAPPLLLRYIRIAGGVGGKLPKWIGSLTHLVEIWFSWTFLRDDDVFGAIHMLPSLKFIDVWDRSYIDDTLVARESKVHNFPSLNSLQVSMLDIRNLKFEEGSMQKLERLSIWFHQDTSDPLEFIGIEHLTSLKEVRLSGYRDNSALNSAVEHIKGVSRSHQNQFQVVVQYR